MDGAMVSFSSGSGGRLLPYIAPLKRYNTFRGSLEFKDTQIVMVVVYKLPMFITFLI